MRLRTNSSVNWTGGKEKERERIVLPVQPDWAGWEQHLRPQLAGKGSSAWVYAVSSHVQPQILSVLSYLIDEITSTSASWIITVDNNLITLAWYGIGLLYVLLIFNFRETLAGGEYMEQAFHYRQH